MEIGNTAMSILEEIVNEKATNPTANSLSSVYNLDVCAKKYVITYEQAKLCMAYLVDKGYIRDSAGGLNDEDRCYRLNITSEGIDAIESKNQN